VPFTCWHHFGLEKQPGNKHAEATIDFYHKFDVDFLKVMSDFPYPVPQGLEKISQPEEWQRVEPLKNPFPEQIKALRLIHKELRGQALFVETIFHSWNVAEKLSSKRTDATEGERSQTVQKGSPSDFRIPSQPRPLVLDGRHGIFWPFRRISL
jgi:hypothetical protein